MKTSVKIFVALFMLLLMVLFYWKETARINKGLEYTTKWNPPTSFWETYKEICNIAKNCATNYDDIKWYITSAKTIPVELCDDEAIGCFVKDKKAIILTDTTQTTVIRHEMMHAAWVNNSFYMNHHCKYFNTKYNTWWFEAC